MRRLGAEALRRMDEVALASDYLAGLRDATKHSVGLFVWGEHGPVLVRSEYGGHMLPMIVRVGTTLPVVSTSAGQVFLAYLPDTLTEPVIRANRTVDQREVSREELARIKDQVRGEGLAVTTDAVLPGVSALAAPVFSTQASLSLVVVILLPRRLASASAVQSVSAELIRTTEAISAELGYVPRP